MGHHLWAIQERQKMHPMGSPSVLLLQYAFFGLLFSLEETILWILFRVLHGNQGRFYRDAATGAELGGVLKLLVFILTKWDLQKSHTAPLVVDQTGGLFNQKEYTNKSLRTFMYTVVFRP
jgi:hypothetical protein